MDKKYNFELKGKEFSIGYNWNERVLAYDSQRIKSYSSRLYKLLWEILCSDELFYRALKSYDGNHVRLSDNVWAELVEPTWLEKGYVYIHFQSEGETGDMPRASGFKEL